MFTPCSSFIDDYTAKKFCLEQLILCPCLKQFLNVDTALLKSEIQYLLQAKPVNIPDEFQTHLFPITHLSSANISALIQHHCKFLNHSIPVHVITNNTIKVIVTPLPECSDQGLVTNIITQTENTITPHSNQIFRCKCGLDFIDRYAYKRHKHQGPYALNHALFEKHDPVIESCTVMLIFRKQDHLMICKLCTEHTYFNIESQNTEIHIHSQLHRAKVLQPFFHSSKATIQSALLARLRKQTTENPTICLECRIIFSHPTAYLLHMELNSHTCETHLCTLCAEIHQHTSITPAQHIQQRHNQQLSCSVHNCTLLNNESIVQHLTSSDNAEHIAHFNIVDLNTFVNSYQIDTISSDKSDITVSGTFGTFKSNCRETKRIIRKKTLSGNSKLKLDAEGFKTIRKLETATRHRNSISDSVKKLINSHPTRMITLKLNDIKTTYFDIHDPSLIYSKYDGMDLSNIDLNVNNPSNIDFMQKLFSNAIFVNNKQKFINLSLSTINISLSTPLPWNCQNETNEDYFSSIWSKLLLIDDKNQLIFVEAHLAGFLSPLLHTEVPTFLHLNVEKLANIFLQKCCILQKSFPNLVIIPHIQSKLYFDLTSEIDSINKFNILLKTGGIQLQISTLDVSALNLKSMKQNNRIVYKMTKPFVKPIFHANDCLTEHGLELFSKIIEHFMIKYNEITKKKI